MGFTTDDNVEPRGFCEKYNNLAPALITRIVRWVTQQVGRAQPRLISFLYGFLQVQSEWQAGAQQTFGRIPAGPTRPARLGYAKR